MNKLDRLKEISQELHDIANSYAGDETGLEATLLHLAGGNIQTVTDSLDGVGGINSFEVAQRYMKWSQQISFLESLGL
jgi:hypothetical protein